MYFTNNERNIILLKTFKNEIKYNDEEKFDKFLQILFQNQ